MEHVQPSELIRYAANELAEPRCAEIAEHLRLCAECRANFERQNALWNTLGDWSCGAPQVDLTSGVERKLAAAAEAPVLQLRLLNLTRIAAAILIGVGVGFWAGRAQMKGTSETPVEMTAAEVENEALTVLGVEYLSQPSPAGLYAGLLDLEADTERAEGES